MLRICHFCWSKIFDSELAFFNAALCVHHSVRKIGVHQKRAFSFLPSTKWIRAFCIHAASYQITLKMAFFVAYSWIVRLKSHKIAAAAYFAMSQRTNRCWIGNFKSLLSEMIFTLLLSQFCRFFHLEEWQVFMLQMYLIRFPKNAAPKM